MIIKKNGIEFRVEKNGGKAVRLVDGSPADYFERLSKVIKNWHGVALRDPDMFYKMFTWCNEQNQNYFICIGSSFYFVDIDDAAACKLRWM